MKLILIFTLYKTPLNPRITGTIEQPDFTVEKIIYESQTGFYVTAVGGATSEHSYAGAKMFLSGNSLARYMIWDGIWFVIYLHSRSEVNPNRIGIIGRSGGGTQSSYIAAFDDHIAASAPENYITSLEYLLKSSRKKR